jgi:hypothetical protein
MDQINTSGTSDDQRNFEVIPLKRNNEWGFLGINLFASFLSLGIK